MFDLDLDFDHTGDAATIVIKTGLDMANVDE